MNDETWKKVLACKDKDRRAQKTPNEVANDLTNDEILTILATIEFFGASPEDIRQAHFDLKLARYRLFDWLAMAVMGRLDCRQAVQVLVHSFLKCDGDVDAFIEDLRLTDYDIDRSWEATLV